jgi:hypothetical protein
MIFKNQLYAPKWILSFSPRRTLRRRLQGLLGQTSPGLTATLLLMTILLATPRLLSTPQPASVTKTSALPVTAVNTPVDPIPVLAYYYIWFDTTSWDRAKTDYPLLGRYSSDDAAVMRQHIQWAKEAGIDGFIVSWKGTEKLNRRLDQLVKLAAEENFKLAIIYEGLDFDRNPLSTKQVDSDLNYFIDHYATNAVFNLFGKPMIIWSGSWKFSVTEIQQIATTKRDRVLILASEKNVAGYQRLADIVDGNAYYWSSVNPATHPGYSEKLTAMGEAVHEKGGLWIAPVATGFDARLIGGTTVVERQDGETLRIEMDSAIQSAPDAIGLISWNEFSENSHIEPSSAFGKRYLQVLAEVRTTSAPKVNNFDSSAPEGINFGTGPFIALFSISALIAISLLSIIIRVNRKNKRNI